MVTNMNISSFAPQVPGDQQMQITLELMLLTACKVGSWEKTPEIPTTVQCGLKQLDALIDIEGVL